MRDILFRGFHRDENGKEQIKLNGEVIRGEWVEGYYARHSTWDKKIVTERIYTGDVETDGGGFYTKWHSIIPETVGEFTGLTDKNGRKIFENDVMALDGWASAHSYEYPGEGDECTVQAEIIFHEGKFIPQLTAEYDDLELMEDAFEPYKGRIQGEIIGNIFEVSE